MLWPGQMQLLQRKQTLLIQTKETGVGLPGLQGGIQAGGSCLGAYMVASLLCVCMSEECNAKSYITALLMPYWNMSDHASIWKQNLNVRRDC